MVVCAAFGFTVSSGNTEIVCLLTQGMPESTATFSVEAASQMHNELVRIPRRECQPQCQPVHRGQSAHTQRMVQLPEVHPRTVRPTERSPRAQNPILRAKVLETMLYSCVTRSPQACNYDTLRRAHSSFLTRCIGWRKTNRAGHPISYMDTLMTTKSEPIEVTLRKRRILFAGLWCPWRVRNCRSACCSEN